MSNKTKYIILLLAGVMIIMLSLSMGASFISPMKIIDIVKGRSGTNEIQILLSLRFPRLIMALLIGASLAVSGVIFQAILKNPLADPYMIGVSSGASLGACFGIIFSMGSIFILSGALIGSLSASSFIYIISQRRRFGSSTLILAGISLSFILWATVLLIFAMTPSQQVHKALMWLMGDLTIARYKMMWKAVILSLVIIAFAFTYHRHLNIIAFGDELAQSTGVTQKDVKTLFWLGSLLAALSVSLAGIIGFVGLIIPHIVRNIFGPDHRRLLVFSAITGALFLAFCDMLGRSIAPPYEIPIGVITGFFGGIFFLVLMMKRGGLQ